MHRSTGRLFITVYLFAGAGLFAPAVRAQDEAASTAPSSNEAAAVPAVRASPSPAAESADVMPSPGASRSTAAPKPAARTGPPLEAGLPGWMWTPAAPPVWSGLDWDFGCPDWATHGSAPAPPMSSGLDWHGNLELDDGYVKYSWDKASFHPVTVLDSRGRFVLGPMLTHDLGHSLLGHNLFLRLTGQFVAWAREVPGGQHYQINADDVYVQVGHQGLWDFMVGRFLTWRVFRKGLGFDLYTLEDTGARTTTDYTDQNGFFPHVYEVNYIFMRDPAITPAGRAALHIYPTPWSGIEIVGTYGHLEGSQDVLGGRAAAGMKLKYFSLLAGAEYQRVWADQQQLTLDSTACDRCGSERQYGAGGSAAVTPLPQIEIAFSLGYGRDRTWRVITDDYDTRRTLSWGGYLQIDVLSFAVNRSLLVGSGFFRTEYRINGADNEYDRQDQLAAYVAYPLGFNNAVVKLVFSEATGYQESLVPGNTTTLNARMYSVRLRFAYYY